MRPILLLTVLTLGACAVVPRPACGCLPPAAPDMPLPTLSPADEAAIVIDALEFACLKEEEPSVFVQGAVQAGWLRQGTPNAAFGAASCGIEVEGPPERIAAVDAALIAWAEGRDLTWNVRDSIGFWDEGRRTIRRVRGEHGQGEGELAWRFVEFQEPGRASGLRLDWSPPRP